MAEPRTARRAGGLRRLAAARRGPEGRDAEAAERLAAAWPLVVGAGLAGRTRLLRVRRGVLVLGAWDVASILPLRQAAEAAWPEVRARVRRFTGLDLAGLVVEPCDPPPPPEARAASSDPLRALVGLLRRRP